MLALVEPFQQRRAAVSPGMDDVEQAVARIGVGRQIEARPDMADVHDLQHQEITGEFLTVQGHLQAFRLGFHQQAAECPAAAEQLLLSGNVGGVDLRHAARQQSQPDRLDEAVLAPGACRGRDVETLFTGVVKRRYQVFRRSGNPKRAGDVVRRPLGQDGDGDAPVRHVGQHPGDRAVAADGDDQVMGLA